MSRFDKLLQRICSLEKNVRFEELRKAGKNPVTIPKHEPIKKVYIQIVKEIIESEENL